MVLAIASTESLDNTGFLSCLAMQPLSRKSGDYQLLTEEEARLETLRGMERFLRPDECHMPESWHSDFKARHT